MSVNRITRKQNYTTGLIVYMNHISGLTGFEITVPITVTHDNYSSPNGLRLLEENILFYHSEWTQHHPQPEADGRVFFFFVAFFLYNLCRDDGNNIKTMRMKLFMWPSLIQHCSNFSLCIPSIVVKKLYIWILIRFKALPVWELLARPYPYQCKCSSLVDAFGLWMQIPNQTCNPW